MNKGNSAEWAKQRPERIGESASGLVGQTDYLAVVSVLT